jgi:transcriptional regulator with XRE-family HTH domain
MLAISRVADIKAVPVKAEERYGNEADRLFSQIIRNSGRPFTPLEQSRVYKRLLDMGWQQCDIAEKSGVSISHVSQVLSLLNMPEAVKQMVTSGQVSATLAQQTVNDRTVKEAVQVLQDGIAIAKKEGKTRVTKRHLNGGCEDEQAIIDGIPIDEDEASAVIEADEKKRVRKLDAEKTLKVVIEAFEYAMVDDECSNEKGEPVVVATFPAAQFEIIRQALKL